MDIGLVGTVKNTIAALLPRLDNGRDTTRRGDEVLEIAETNLRELALE